MHVFSITKGRLKEIKINQLESRAQELNISKKLNFLQSNVQKNSLEFTLQSKKKNCWEDFQILFWIMNFKRTLTLGKKPIRNGGKRKQRILHFGE